MQEICAVIILFSLERVAEVDLCGGLFQYSFAGRRVICLQGRKAFALRGAHQQVVSASSKFATGELPIASFVEVVGFPFRLIGFEDIHGESLS